jgi:RNA polymerase sigma-70 factor (ECF subfamily)
MTALADHNSAETAALLARTRDGDSTAAAPLFERPRARLKRMVDLRLDRRLVGRVDPMDVVRDACSGAAGRLAEYLRAPDEPVFLWLRRRVAERLAALHREHLGTPDPGAGLELSLYRDALPVATPAALAACLLGQHPTAARVGAAVKRVLRVQDGLNALDPLDRELLALRHFEQLSREEAARALQIDEGMATRRYVRALKKLNELLAAPDSP